jgi:hypothetical protein
VVDEIKTSVVDLPRFGSLKGFHLLLLPRKYDLRGADRLSSIAPPLSSFMGDALPMLLNSPAVQLTVHL